MKPAQNRNLFAHLLLCIGCCAAAALPALGQSLPTLSSRNSAVQAAQKQPIRAQDAGSPIPTRAEMLRGAYGPFRANNDLLYYHLDIRVDPRRSSSAGRIRFASGCFKDGTRIQIDLTRNAEYRQDSVRRDAAEI